MRWLDVAAFQSKFRLKLLGKLGLSNIDHFHTGEREREREREREKKKKSILVQGWKKVRWLIHSIRGAPFSYF